MINLAIAHGEKVAIVGATGAGKSTLVRVASHLHMTESDVQQLLDALDRNV